MVAEASGGRVSAAEYQRHMLRKKESGNFPSLSGIGQIWMVLKSLSGTNSPSPSGIG